MAGSCNSIYTYFLVNKGTTSFNFEESPVSQASPAFLSPHLLLFHVMLKEGSPFNLCTKVICHLPLKVYTYFALQFYSKANSVRKGKMYLSYGCIYYFVLIWHILHLPLIISFSPPNEEIDSSFLSKG